MEYKLSIGEEDAAGDEIMLEKYTDSKGFFRNVGLSKIGEIRFYNNTESMWFENLLTEEYRIYYMKLLCINKGSLFTSYRGEAPRISIGDKKHNIPVEDRIKFLYESLSYNTNYNYLRIISINPVLGVQILLFKINKWDFRFEDRIAFFIKDLNKV